MTTWPSYDHDTTAEKNIYPPPPEEMVTRVPRNSRNRKSQHQRANLVIREKSEFQNFPSVRSPESVPTKNPRGWKIRKNKSKEGERWYHAGWPLVELDKRPPDENKNPHTSTVSLRTYESHRCVTKIRSCFKNWRTLWVISRTWLRVCKFRKSTGSTFPRCCQGWRKFKEPKKPTPTRQHRDSRRSGLVVSSYRLFPGYCDANS